MKMIIFVHGCDSPGIGAIIIKVLMEKNSKVLDFKIININGFFSLMLSIETTNYIDTKEVEESLKLTLNDYTAQIHVVKDMLPSECIKRQKEDWIPYKVKIICSNQTESLYYFMNEMQKYKINVSMVDCVNVNDMNDESHQIEINIQVPLFIEMEVLKTSLADISRSLNIIIDIEPEDNLNIGIS